MGGEPRTLEQENERLSELAQTDFAAAKDLGVRAEHALSLPARCAPQTAGELVADTVQTILQEREDQP